MARSNGSSAAQTRAAAATAVLAVEHGRALDEALAAVASEISPDQRGLLGELAFGTCRWYYRLTAVARQMLRKPLRKQDKVLLPLILVGLYQILYTRIPAHAAVAETVEATRVLGKKAASGLVNGVLRRFQRESEALLATADATVSGRFAFPDWLAAEIRSAWPDDWQAVLDASNERPPMTLRVNLAKGSLEEYEAALRAEDIGARRVVDVATALTLDSPMPVERLPGFTEGRVSVQDTAAQMAAHILGARAGERVLDACAAPGGKTTHIAESAAGLKELVALDSDPTRLERVRENLQRVGVEALIVEGDATAPDGGWADGVYDRILLDAPCSATGVIRRHPDIKLLRRSRDVADLVRRQRQMLDALWPRLAPGGILLYSTCSVLPQENRMQLEGFLDRQSDAAAQRIALSFGRMSGPGWQILPGDGGADGFFYAALLKHKP